MRILLAEDERALSKAIVKIFEKNNYSADAVYDGEEALNYLELGCYDVAVLDIMMPKMDGITVLKKLRAAGNQIPVLMLTAKSEIEDRVLGLDSGANDYLPKPFDTRELLARIRSITRTQTAADNKLTFGSVSLDRATFELSSPSGSFRLANKEYQIMEYLMANPHRIISPEMFMEKIWGYDSETELNVVWVYISYLRKKLTALQADIQIKSSRNAGYSLENCHD
ncbi:MAG: response regulator transcription factor [Clostridia bacterium]|nr:response regulator transcription factor [Clostridia bacterium]